MVKKLSTSSLSIITRKLSSARVYYKEHGWANFVTVKILDRLVYLWYISQWFLSPRLLLRDITTIKIDRPIFLLGVQGGGLTLISRILHRHPKVVTVGGPSRFWTGNDEMHTSSYLKYLPDQLVLRSPGYRNMTGREEWHPVFGYERTWVYATHYFIDQYRLTADHCTQELKDAFLNTIRKAILIYSNNPREARFLDKSQTYSLKVPFIVRALEGSNPRFIVVTMNPWATAWKMVTGPHRHIWDNIPNLRNKVRLAAEHWNNTFLTAIRDLDRELPGDYCVVRFEDFLSSPKETMKRVFDYCELEFSEEFLPKPGDKLPLGSPDRRKWWPIIPDVNERFLKDIPRWAVDEIEDICADVASELGYKRPK